MYSEQVGECIYIIHNTKFMSITDYYFYIETSLTTVLFNGTFWFSGL